jgi:hypothetical protein
MLLLELLQKPRGMLDLVADHPGIKRRIRLAPDGAAEDGDDLVKVA